MPNRCSDPNCNAGRKNSQYTGSYFTVPSDDKEKTLREQWLAASPFKYTQKNAVLCERHFFPQSIIKERRDSNDRRDRGVLKRKHLLPGTVPCVWPEWPSYYSRHVPTERSPATTAEERRSRAEEIKQEEENKAREYYLGNITYLLG